MVKCCSLPRQYFPVYLVECHKNLETGTVLFNIFTRYFEVIKSSFLRFGGNLISNSLFSEYAVGSATMQKNLGRLDKWAKRNLRKFSKDKCNVPFTWEC